MMSVPSELSLIKQENGYRIRFRPAGEIRDRFSLCNEYTPESGGCVIHPSGKPVVLKAGWRPGQAKEITAGGKTVCIRAKADEAVFIVDDGVIEYWADGGLICGSAEVDEDVLFHPISIGPGVTRVSVFEFRGTPQEVRQ